MVEQLFNIYWGMALLFSLAFLFLGVVGWAVNNDMTDEEVEVRSREMIKWAGLSVIWPLTILWAVFLILKTRTTHG